MARKKIAFGWYGGKYSHLEWLLPLLPQTNHYCEPFGGSAAVLLNREPAPVETYNDIDSEVVNFFKVLREQKEELIYAIGLTPFSREEFVLAIETNGHSHGLSELERARRFFIRARQVRTGLAQTASVGRWANCLNTSRAGMAGAVSRWLGSVEGLEWIASRLLRVQIEHDHAFNIIKRYDSPNTLFYCDPPYPHDSRGDSKAYQYEMTDEAHVELHQLLSQVKGKVAISGYHGDLMDELYQDWNVHEEKSKKAHSIKTERVEVLWTNYGSDSKTKHLNLRLFERKSGQNIYVSNFFDFSLGVLILLGEEGRVDFLDRVGKELDRVNSAIIHRRTWASLLKQV